MENEHLQQLKKVASVFNADDGGNILFGNEVIFKTQSLQKKEKLTDYLAGFIYSNCYCRNNTGMVFQAEKKPGEAIDEEFINRLRTANTVIDKNPGKWQVIFHMPNGDPVVSKGTDAFSVHKSQVVTNPTLPGDTTPVFAEIKNQKEHNSNENSFYFIFSDNPESKRSGSLLRFYWNIEASGVPILVNKLTSGLNRHFVPFQFKCLKHPDLYSRHDACVLYIFPKYLHITCNIIRQFMDEVKPLLKDDVPMFTLKLSNGLSFAESPGGGQSFGMRHAGILSETLMIAFENRLDDSQKLTHITDTYQSLGYDLNCPYKNPGSINNYNFLKQEIN